MRKPAEMSDEEIVAHLKFGPDWWRLGLMDEERLRTTIANFRHEDDPNDEHWRFGAFVSFLARQPTLSEEQLEGLFELGAADPDSVMGGSIMLKVLERRDCPAYLRRRAVSHPRTRKYWGDYQPDPGPESDGRREGT